tara:strand:- start:3740 stop:4216 length:477 start_codon:yes stop_codon:yes gene_type:complete
MKIAIFDVDDTLIKHALNCQSYYTGYTKNNFKSLLTHMGYEKIYLYTNGTYGHGASVVEHLGLDDKISFIYARDNLRNELHTDYMKPHLNSFTFVNASIQSDCGSTTNEIYFFDDLKKNLEVAKSIGWNTILIQSNGFKERYIDYVFPSIYAALISMI